jgi:hypothetical protein
MTLLILNRWGYCSSAGERERGSAGGMLAGSGRRLEGCLCMGCLRCFLFCDGGEHCVLGITRNDEDHKGTTRRRGLRQYDYTAQSLE